VKKKLKYPELRIYLTHCFAKKEDSLINTSKSVGPDVLYTATPAQRFMNECKKKQVKWAIFSDLYGVWFPTEKHKWYNKHPNTVSEKEFKDLVKNFEEKLGSYDESDFRHIGPNGLHHCRIPSALKQ
jgi:hypothetical protein